MPDRQAALERIEQALIEEYQKDGREERSRGHYWARMAQAALAAVEQAGPDDVEQDVRLTPPVTETHPLRVRFVQAAPEGEESVVKILSAAEVQDATKKWLESGGAYGAIMLPAFVETIETAREAIRLADHLFHRRFYTDEKEYRAWLVLPAVVEARKEEGEP